MEIKEFIEKFAETLEVENTETLNKDTKFRDLEEWSSLTAMITISEFNEEFKKIININDIKNVIQYKIYLIYIYNKNITIKHLWVQLNII